MGYQESHPINVDTVRAVGTRASTVLQRVRDHIQHPDKLKHPPQFSTAQMGGIVGLDRVQVQTRIGSSVQNPLPKGTMIKRRRSFSLVDLQQWCREFRSAHMRPAGVPGCVITLAHFKGGSGKTSTAATLAHGLSRLGHRGLVIDSDPQGSLTTLFGLLPDVEIHEDQTLLRLYEGDRPTEDGNGIEPAPSDLEYAIRPTYWPGIDIVPASSGLFAADFLLPSRQLNQGREFEFYRLLDLALDTCRPKYDFIIIDTPPSLSYVTMNALMAADGIVMPLPPQNLDFASSTQFWMLFQAMQESFRTHGKREKQWAFIELLPTRVRPTGQSSPIVMEWMLAAYQLWMSPIQVPDLEAVRIAAKNFSTVFDAPPKAQVDEDVEAPTNATSRSMQTAVDVYERLSLHIESKMTTMWRKAGE